MGAVGDVDTPWDTPHAVLDFYDTSSCGSNGGRERRSAGCGQGRSRPGGCPALRGVGGLSEGASVYIRGRYQMSYIYYSREGRRVGAVSQSF